MIMKMQRTISPPNGPVLVYDEGKSILMFVEPTPGVLAMFGDKLKIYVEVTLDSDTGIEAGKVVKDQPW